MSSVIDTNHRYVHNAIAQRENEAAVGGKKNAALPQEDMQREAPAYIVEVESFLKDEIDTMLEKRKDFASEDKAQFSIVEDASEGTEEKFFQDLLSKMDRVSASISNSNFDASGVKMSREQGDAFLASVFSTIRHAADRGCSMDFINSDIETELSEYYNVAEAIERGGKDKLLSYNLMFAGIASVANEAFADRVASKFVEENGYSEETYGKLKAFAADLQKKANVYISPDFKYYNYEDIARADGITYSYMGAMCSIGVQTLGFMAEHREADDVWVKVAQGAYQDQGEMLQDLREHGYADVADAYVSQESAIRSKGGSVWNEADIAQLGFGKKDGALWDATVGYQKNSVADTQVLKDLKVKYLGDAEAKVAYTGAQLQAAYREGKKKAEVLGESLSISFSEALSKNISEKVAKDISAKEEKQTRLEELKKQLQEINQEIKNIRSHSMSEKEKSEKIEQLENERKSIQMQVDDALQQMRQD